MTKNKSLVKSDQSLRLFSSRRQPPLLVCNCFLQTLLIPTFFYKLSPFGFISFSFHTDFNLSLPLSNLFLSFTISSLSFSPSLSFRCSIHYTVVCSPQSVLCISFACQFFSVCKDLHLLFIIPFPFPG